MKTKLQSLIMGLTLLTSVHQSTAQGTAFTYQGRLQSGTNAANGTYNFTFSLYDTATGGSQVGNTQTNLGVGVTNGLFITTVDFGPVFAGASNWLQIAVTTNGSSAFTNLTPRQQLTPTPYAIFAGTASNLSGMVASANLSGTYGDALTLNNAANSFTGNGSGLTSLNASQLTSGTVPDVELPANVALLNGNQSFTGSNSFSGLNANLSISGTGPINTNIFTGLGFQFYNNSGEGAIMASVNDTAALLTFYTKPGPGFPPTRQMKIDRYGVLFIDQQNANYGALNDGTTNGDGIVFGGDSGEGIASQRTAGFNQNGLDFYTSHTRQMSILNDGNVGIGTTNPTTALQVNGTVTATSFSGNGAGLTNLNAAQFSGTLTLAQLPAAVVTNNNVTSVTLSGTFSGSGGGLTNVNAATLGGLSSAGFWKTNGNAGANPTNGAFLGTTDNNPLELHVNATRALRLEPDSRGYGVPTLIGGYVGNAVLQPGSGGDFIGGGGVSPTPNLIYSNSSGVFIGAGSGNEVGPDVNDAVLAGGNGNTIQSPDAVVGGGVNNLVTSNAQYSFIGGGENNSNSAMAGTIGGGLSNSVTGAYGTVPGGDLNVAAQNSFAAGHRAKATQQGSFVWADSENADFIDANTNQFLVRANGNIALTTVDFGAGFAADGNDGGLFMGIADGLVSLARLTSPSNMSGITLNDSGQVSINSDDDGHGVVLTPGSGSWTSLSDRNAKKNFQPVDTVALLDKLVAIPVEQRNYKWEKDTDVPNIGPMAQDFKHAFYPGRDDKGISTLEFDGVELAAIQGLNQKLKEKDAKISELEKRLADLEQMVQTLAAKK